MGENNIGLRYGVSTYDDVLPAMNRAAKNITLTGVPNVADPIVWSKKIYGQTGWFELQFQHEDVTYTFNSKTQRWSGAPEVSPTIYSDDYDGSVVITAN